MTSVHRLDFLALLSVQSSRSGLGVLLRSSVPGGDTLQPLWRLSFADSLPAIRVVYMILKPAGSPKPALSHPSPA